MHGHLRSFAVYTCDYDTAKCIYNRTDFIVSDSSLTTFNSSYYSLLINGLRPCNVYSFAVCAVSGGGEGVISQTVSRRTGDLSMFFEIYLFQSPN